MIRSSNGKKLIFLYKMSKNVFKKCLCIWLLCMKYKFIWSKAWYDFLYHFSIVNNVIYSYLFETTVQNFLRKNGRRKYIEGKFEIRITSKFYVKMRYIDFFSLFIFNNFLYPGLDFQKKWRLISMAEFSGRFWCSKTFKVRVILTSNICYS